MGACGSTHSGCVKVGDGLKKKKTRRASSSSSANHHSLPPKKLNKVEPCAAAAAAFMELSYTNPTFQLAEAWFDTATTVESDCDDEFFSVRDDVSQIGSGSAVVTPRFSDNADCNGNSWLKPSVSPRAFVQQPIAGSQLACCPLEKKMPDSWSRIEANTFRVRGQNYFRDKRKVLASSHAAFYPFGVDVFLSPRKIDHVARFVELPVVESAGDFPPILVVNIQMPLYPAALFQNEYDGEGMSFVLYFKLNNRYAKELPVSFRDGIRKLIHNEVEKIKGFPVDTQAHFRERLKIMGRVVNVEDLALSAAERKLISSYNEKPVLSRPQHEFYSGENYFEIDLDMHRFSYIARKGFEAFQDKLKHCVLDFGLTIQGSKAEDLPEHMLCCIRLKEIDYTNYNRLGF